MNIDWQSNLAALRGSLPEGDDAQLPAAEETPQAVADTLHVSRSTKGRAGKTATLVEGFTCSDADVAEVASRLRKALGTGGSSRGGEILIQGDRREQVATLLREYGYKVKVC